MAGEKMLSSILLAICLVGGYLALNENEWRDVAVELAYKSTKSFGQHDYNKVVDLLSDDSEELIPNGPNEGKAGFKPIIETMSISSEYFGFLELLYSSPDVAMTRQVSYRKQLDGTVKTLKGVLLLVQENDEVRIKMAAYNYD